MKLFKMEYYNVIDDIMKRKEGSLSNDINSMKLIHPEKCENPTSMAKLEQQTSLNKFH